MEKEQHFQLLATLHIIAGTFGLIIVLLARIFIGIGEPFLTEAISNLASEAEVLVQFLIGFVRIIGYLFLFGMILPSLLGAIAFIQNKRWGLYLLVISGGIRLINFPLGTALGVYTIWVYFTYKNRLFNDQN